MSELDHVSFRERLELGQAIGWLTGAQTITPALMSKLEEAAARHPTSWIVHYTLGDYYCRLGRFVDALRANHKCEELSHFDIRSVYALATTYRYIANAKVLTLPPEQRIQIERDMPYLEQSRVALLDLEITPVEAAQEAMKWMVAAYELAQSAPAIDHLHQNIVAMKRQFPELA